MILEIRYSDLLDAFLKHHNLDNIDGSKIIMEWSTSNDGGALSRRKEFEVSDGKLISADERRE